VREKRELTIIFKLLKNKTPNKMKKQKFSVSTPYRAELIIDLDIQVNKAGNIVIGGIPGVTYEMYDGELCLCAYSEHGELNCSGRMIDWELTLDDKPLEEGMDYWVFHPKEMELIRTVLDSESEWTGLMFWTVGEAIQGLAHKYKDELVKVYDYEKFDVPHYLIKI
jgi:hypothetical protein